MSTSCAATASTFIRVQPYPALIQLKSEHKAFGFAVFSSNFLSAAHELATSMLGASKVMTRAVCGARQFAQILC